MYLLILFLIAALYAGVGHGGASGYLALMALWGVAPATMRPAALMLNIAVSLVAFLQYWRGGHFRWSLFWPLALMSAPMAYLGGQIKLDAAMYQQVLGVLLVVAALRFLWQPARDVQPTQTPSTGPLLLIGGTIGFVSGLIGIGGGIILSPVLLFLRWSSQKNTAAVSAAFILINSISGLAGQIAAGWTYTTDLTAPLLVAVTGGFAGAYVGAQRLPAAWLQYVLAAVLMIAGIKLILH